MGWCFVAIFFLVGVGAVAVGGGGGGGGDHGNKNCKHPYHNMLGVLSKSGGWSVSRPTPEHHHPPDNQVTIMCDTATDLHEGSVR